MLATADNGDRHPGPHRRARRGRLRRREPLARRDRTSSTTSALPAGTLDGANALADGVPLDAELAARFRLEDPGLGSLRYGAEAYDATILAALAAILAGDDGGASIARTCLRPRADGIQCACFGECLDVLTTEPDIDYDGVTGPVDLDADGDRDHGLTRCYVLRGENNTRDVCRQSGLRLAFRAVVTIAARYTAVTRSYCERPAITR